jgi:hypothetical protein
MLALRLIAPNDYTVLDDGQPIGRIRHARERSPSIWLWHVTMTLPGPPFGDAKTIDEAKARFKAAWMMFKDKHGAEEIGAGLRGDEPCQPDGPVSAVMVVASVG